MKHRTIHIRGWRVDVFIDNGDTNGYLYDVWHCLEEMEAPRDIEDKVQDLLRGGKPNQAFTYSNGRRTCIYIGWTTSGEEFINSMIHEIRHLVDHIAEYYDLPNNEAVGYLSGDTAFLLAEDICAMGCPCCGKEER